MCEVVEISDDEDTALPEIIPKNEGLEYDRAPEMDIPPGSSGISLRSSFITMGFSPSHVDKAIQENGENNAELLLETLSAPSQVSKQPKAEISDDGLFSGYIDALTAGFHPRETLHKSKSSDSLDSLFDEDEDINKNASGAGKFLLKEEPDVGTGVSDEKLASMLKMNFSLDEVRFALDRLGKDARMDQLMDFIFAARMAKKYDKNGNSSICGDEERKKECNNEDLFSIMEKTLRLLEMGFSEQQISTAFEKCGSEVPLDVLTNSIVAPVDKHSSNYNSSSAQSNGYLLYRKANNCSSGQPFDSFTIKTEDHSSDVAPQVGISDLLEKIKGKRPKVEYMDVPLKRKTPDSNTGVKVSSTSTNNWRKARSASMSNQVSTPQNSFKQLLSIEEDIKPSIEEDIKPTISVPNPSNSLKIVAAKPPYFVYGNVSKLSHESWVKVSQFLGSIPPEFVKTELHSALSRIEGYVHNLPVEDRSHIFPRGPMTIEEALPHTRKWWPSWDRRKQLSHINCESNRISHRCESLGRMLAGVLSSERQNDLLQQCEKLNLIWVGNNKLGPLEPEHLERIMGYPPNHTRVPGISSLERLKSLKFSFQTDTLGYYMSVLKRLQLSLGGLAVLSFFTGIGGAEVALHRLGFHLKVVVSVEPCELKRKILKQWWEKTQQTGELIQSETIHNISGNIVEDLIRKYGGFDLVVCQNPNSDADGDSLSGVNFSLFVEFVRILQRVRIAMGE